MDYFANLKNISRNILMLMLLSASFECEVYSQTDSLVIFSGTLIDEDNEKPVPYAYIASYTQHLMYSTDSSGRFYVYLPVHDSLRIVTLGFEPLIVQLDSLNLNSGQDVVIPMKRTSYLLDNVDVNLRKGFFEKPLKDTVKKKIIHLDDLTPGQKNIVDIREVMALQRAKAGTFGITPGTIMMIARLFKKNRKKKKHVIFEFNNTHLKEMTSSHYLGEYTGFSGTKLDSFVVFLNKHYTFDPGFDDYKILEVIQDAFENFVAINEETNIK